MSHLIARLFRDSQTADKQHCQLLTSSFFAISKVDHVRTVPCRNLNGWGRSLKSLFELPLFNYCSSCSCTYGFVRLRTSCSRMWFIIIICCIGFRALGGVCAPQRQVFCLQLPVTECTYQKSGGSISTSWFVLQVCKCWEAFVRM